MLLLTTMAVEWKLIQVYPAMVLIGARTSNRLFVGLPLCEHIQMIAY
jgi:hypothetical protein